MNTECLTINEEDRFNPEPVEILGPGELRDMNAECHKRFFRYLDIKERHGDKSRKTKTAWEHYLTVEDPYREALEAATVAAKVGEQ